MVGTRFVAEHIKARSQRFFRRLLVREPVDRWESGENVEKAEGGRLLATIWRDRKCPGRDAMPISRAVSTLIGMGVHRPTPNYDRQMEPLKIG